MVDAEGIDCHFAHGGYLSLSRSDDAAAARAASTSTHLQSYGFTDDDYRVLSKYGGTERCGATRWSAAAFTPHCAAVHPARLARGLARTVERLGRDDLRAHAGRRDHAATRCAPHRGTVTADVVVRATEAFTPRCPAMRRARGTDLLADDRHRAAARRRSGQAAGLHERATFNDGRHMIVYGQRTADDRFAFGGRGARYHWGSTIKPEYDRDERVHRLIHDTLRELFPAHRRCGDHSPLGRRRRGGTRLVVPCSIRSRRPGIASAGGYVGDGVGTTNLAGRTLADLITGEPTAI